MRRVVLLIAAASVTLSASACGSSGGDSSTGAVFQRYANLEYGFALNYPNGYPEYEDEPSPGTNPAVFRALFADTADGTSGGASVTAIQVLVFQLNKPASAKDVPKSKAAVEGMMAKFTKGLKGLRVTEPLELRTLNDLPAWYTAYVYRVNGVDMATLSYILLEGDYAYWASAQASKKERKDVSRLLASSLASFSVVPILEPDE